MPPSACVYYCVPPVRISRNGETSQAPVAEWYTRQVEGLCQKWRGGSSPLGGTARYNDDDVLEQAPQHVMSFLAFSFRAASSVGRASRLHRECRGFESLAAHPYPLQYPLLYPFW